jgi:hypothetical protein
MQYLSALRKTELEDPSHKWIGIYNTRQMVLSKFFKWLYNQNEPDYKKGLHPLVCKESKHYRENKNKDDIVKSCSVREQTYHRDDEQQQQLQQPRESPEQSEQQAIIIIIMQAMWQTNQV